MLVSSNSSGSIEVTVFIPTYNGEKYLDQILTNLEEQISEDNFEIFIIDSGSTDKTLSIIAQHPLVRLFQIPNHEFGHGKTRNLAAQMARGKYIVYLSHDAVPQGNSFLNDLVAPLKPPIQGGCGAHGVVGKHIARRNCAPSIKYGIIGVFEQCGPDDRITLVDGSKKLLTDLAPGQLFYSDVCSATSKEFLLEKLPYQDLPYAEDMAFGKDLINGGYVKAYQPAAVVEHSNDVTLREYPKRMFDETLGLRRIEANANAKNFTFMSAMLRCGKEALIYSRKVLKDSDYSWWQKPYWVAKDFLFLAARWLGIYRGKTVNLNDVDAIARYSLEAERA